MSHRRLLAVLSGALMLLLAPASAHAVLLKGTVSGAPYVATPSQTAVPVIFSKQTAKRAGMQSPVGIIVIPRQRKVSSHQGGVSPSALRLGDRFRFDARVNAEAKRAIYTRLATNRLYIYKRSKNLSTAELEAALKQVQGQVRALEQYVTALATYTTGNINALRADVSNLRADINALRADVEALRAALGSLQGVTETIKTQVDQLLIQVSSLLTTVSGLTTQINELQTALVSTINKLTGDTTTTLTSALTSLGAMQTLQSQLGALSTEIANATAPLGASIDQVRVTLYGADGTGDAIGAMQTSLQAAIASAETTLNGKITALCTGTQQSLNSLTVAGIGTAITVGTALSCPT